MNPPPNYSSSYSSYAPPNLGSYAPPTGYSQPAAAGAAAPNPAANGGSSQSYAAPSYSYSGYSGPAPLSTASSNASPSPSPYAASPTSAAAAASPASYSSYAPPSASSYQPPSNYLSAPSAGSGASSSYASATPSPIPQASPLASSSYSSYSAPSYTSSTSFNFASAPSNPAPAASQSFAAPASNPAPAASHPPNSAAAFYSSYVQSGSSAAPVAPQPVSHYPGVSGSSPSPPPASYADPNAGYPRSLPPLSVSTYGSSPSASMAQPSPRFRPPPVELPPQPEIQPPLDSVFNQVRPVNPFVGDDGRAISRPPPATMNSFAPKGQAVSYHDPYASEGNTPDGPSPMESPMQPQRQLYQPSSHAQGQSGASQPAKKVDRIDPKQIPRPAEIRGNVIKYFTRSGQIPPPALSDYQVVDEGNCSPRFVRLTTNHFAAESELIDQTKLCIGAIIQPLAPLGDGEEPIAVVDYPNGPLRCSRCMAYVNPFFQFVDQGASFVCNICSMKNDVPEEYRCNLDPNGQRRDRNERAELCRGSVEFAVGADFITRPIQDPCYLFVLDVSYTSVSSGLLATAIAGIRSALDCMASNPRVRVGLITYDTSVQFYALQSGRTDPVLYVMSDMDDVFVPCPMDQVCVHLSKPEMRVAFESLLDLLTTIHSRKSPDSPVSCFGAAVAVAAEALLETGGKVMMIQSSLPGVGAGKLENRDNPAAYNTPQERALQSPSSPYYTTIATKCAENAITVDLFICASGYVDLATIGALAEKTGGQLFFYPRFSHVKDSYAFERDVYHNLTRSTGFDAVMVVRCSNGLKVAEYFGNFYHRRVNEMDLPTIDSDKTFGIRLEHEAKMKDKSEACIQMALLYTTAEGQRRIRVHTISVPVTAVMSNIYRYSDLDAIINLSLKQAVRQILDSTTLEDAQKALTTACVDSLYVYRKFCASATSAGQLILPEPLKLLPLNTLGLIKHLLFRENVHADERSFIYSFINSMPCYVSVAFVCPRLFSCLDMQPQTCYPDENGRVYLPTPLSLSSESVQADGLYVLDDGRALYLLVGPELSREWIDQLLEAEPIAGSDPARPQYQYTKLRTSEDPSAMCSRVSCLIDTLRKQKANFQNLHIVFRRANAGGAISPDEASFNAHLIEDSVSLKKGNHPGNNNAMLKPTHTMSYVDFLCWLHRQIQNKFY